VQYIYHHSTLISPPFTMKNCFVRGLCTGTLLVTRSLPSQRSILPQNSTEECSKEVTHAREVQEWYCCHQWSCLAC